MDSLAKRTSPPSRRHEAAGGRVAEFDKQLPRFTDAVLPVFDSACKTDLAWAACLSRLVAHSVRLAWARPVSGSAKELLTASA